MEPTIVYDNCLSASLKLTHYIWISFHTLSKILLFIHFYDSRILNQKNNNFDCFRYFYGRFKNAGNFEDFEEERKFSFYFSE